MEVQLEEAIEACIEQGPQLITLEDEPKAILVSHKEWEDLQARLRPETE
jgi:PHD/YefM family antitoxin component YafN of YafNO toxin-antitoxin module